MQSGEAPEWSALTDLRYYFGQYIRYLPLRLLKVILVYSTGMLPSLWVVLLYFCEIAFRAVSKVHNAQAPQAQSFLAVMGSHISHLHIKHSPPSL